MTPLPWRRPSPETRDRRRAVERRLAAHGLLPRAGRVGRAIEPDSLVPRLRAALPEIGPAFALFGLYLASRPDLFDATDCALLATIPDRGEPLAAAEVERLLASELRPGAFADVAPGPFAADLLGQCHRAWPGEGREVVVRIVPPALAAEVTRDADLLALLAPAFRGHGIACDELVADFRRDLETRLDLGLQAAALEELARDAEASDLAAAPHVFRELTTAHVLTREWLDGAPLESAEAAGDAAAHELARRICLLWLQLALTRRRFPVAADLLRLRDGRVGLAGGTFTAPRGVSQRNLWSYLRAIALHDPDMVFDCLAREIAAGARAVPTDELRKRLRQTVPALDGAVVAGGDGLADHAVAHCRVLQRCGYRPSAAFLDFVRGLHWAARAARRAAPGSAGQEDTMREALDDLQWLAGWAQLRQLADPRQMGATLESYLTTLSVLPQQVERALQVLSRERARPAVETDSVSRPRGSTATAAACGLAMGAVAVLTLRFSALAAPLGQWTETLGALVFLLLGACMLRAAGGRGR